MGSLTMETGTFPKIGTGESQEDPIRPDVSSLDGTVVMWEQISDNGTDVTVRYQRSFPEDTSPDDTTDTPTP